MTAADRPDETIPPAPESRSFLAMIAGDRVLPAVVAATAAVSVVAVAFPGIDIAVSRLFHRPGVVALTEFPLEHNAVLGPLRQVGLGVTRWIIIALVLLGLAKALTPLLARMVPSRPLLFLAVSLTIGPGLVVNSLFKEWWGRPRPQDVTLFGGPDTFFPAWIPGGACPTNCSFPSGEASSSMWLIAFVFVVPLAWRRATLIAALLFALVISANRIAFGGHFLSDVLIGWGMTATVVLVCRHWILERMPEAQVRWLEGAFAKVGSAVLRALGCRDRIARSDAV